MVRLVQKQPLEKVPIRDGAQIRDRVTPMNRKKEAVLLNIKFHREIKMGRMMTRDKEKIFYTKYRLLSLDVAADPQGVL